MAESGDCKKCGCGCMYCSNVKKFICCKCCNKCKVKLNKFFISTTIAISLLFTSTMAFANEYKHVWYTCPKCHYSVKHKISKCPFDHKKMYKVN
jgi:hypothetical protein